MLPMAEAEWPQALRAGRPLATSLALWAFMLGFTLDDLHLVRLPLLYAGLAGAVLVYAFAPPFLAARALRRARRDRPDAPGDALDSAVAFRRATLALTVAALVGWLVLFSNGRTPRW